MTRVVCLLSGGLDSCVTATIAKNEGHDIYPLTFEYGQRHKKEVQCAKKIGIYLGAHNHVILKLHLGDLGRSSLLGTTPLPPGVEKRDVIPSTYVPARNTIFLSYALAYAEVLGAQGIYIGATCVDYSGYPDCRPEYFHAFQSMANLATKRGVEGHPITIETPLVHLSKAEIIKRGIQEGAPFHLTWSCYAGGKEACGHCDACLLRLKGFREAGIQDPIDYEHQ